MRGGPVGNDLPLLHPLALANDRLLIEACAFVQAMKFAQRILVGVIDDDSSRIDRRHGAVAGRPDKHAAIDCDRLFHARCDDWRIGPQKRYGLPLHVGTHQRAVRIVVLKEWNQRRRHRDGLPGADIDILHVFAGHSRQVAFDSGEHHALVNLPSRLHAVRRGENGLHFFVGTQILYKTLLLHRIGRLPASLFNRAILHHAIGRDQKSVVVDVRIDRQRRNQTDVRAFRRFDRADTAIVADVHVAHLEAGPLAIQTAGTQRGQTSLVRQL